MIRFRRAIARKQGLCVILGGNGMGKSSLLRYLASGYEPDEMRTVSYFADSRKFKSSFDFLKMISADFGIAPKRSQTAQMDAIEEFLVPTTRPAKPQWCSWCSSTKPSASTWTAWNWFGRWKP